MEGERERDGRSARDAVTRIEPAEPDRLNPLTSYSLKRKQFSMMDKAFMHFFEEKLLRPKTLSSIRWLNLN